jgi:signal transduction histidine kinase
VSKIVAAAHARARVEAILSRPWQGSSEDALRLKEELLLLARQVGEPALIAEALLWQHCALLELRPRAEAQCALEQVRSIAFDIGDVALEAARKVEAARALCLDGQYLEAIRSVQRALHSIERHRDAARVRLDALGILCEALLACGLWDETIEHAQCAVQLAATRADDRAAQQAARHELHARFRRGLAHCTAGITQFTEDADLQRVESITRDCLRRSATVGRLPPLSSTDARRLLLQVLLHSGRSIEALRIQEQQANAGTRGIDRLEQAQLALVRGKARQALDIESCLLDGTSGLTAYDKTVAWALVSRAHEQLGEHGRACDALRQQVKLELDQGHASTAAKAALIEIDIEAKGEQPPIERALAHAAKPAAVGRLASSMVHEISQPCSALVLLNADAKQAWREGRSELLAELLIDMDRQVARLARIIDRMKPFSADAPLTVKRLNLRQTVSEALKLCQPSIDATKVRCTVDVPDLEVLTDQETVILSVVNLVNNALDALRDQTEPAPRLHIEATAGSGSQPTKRLSVIDNGPGLSAGAIAHFLEPFYTTKETGLGLGLSITRGALARVQAKLEARNNNDRGACFTLVFQPIQPIVPPQRETL